ncbi:putative virulence factor [Patescibacteria group bacterium]|nr:putative virulence factor [Patescibacteria group bacterium]
MSKLTSFVLCVVSVLALALAACAPQVTVVKAPEVEVEQNTTVVVVQDCGGNCAPADASASAPVQASGPTTPTLGTTVITGTLPCGAPIPNVQEPIQVRDMVDALCYPIKVKYHIANMYYCAAIEYGASMPSGHTEIERWDVTQGDGNYLHATGDFGMAAFCSDDPVAKHFAPEGTVWQIGLLEQDGFKEVEFPISE